jgi:hypothetical protein
VVVELEVPAVRAAPAMVALALVKVMVPPELGNSPVSLTAVVNVLIPGTPTVVSIAVARPLYL